MATIREVMTAVPIVLRSETSASEAARRMRDADVGDVLVADDRLLGIVTDRDLVLRVIADDVNPDDVTLGEICSADLHTVSPDDRVKDAIDLMRQRAIRRVPVIKNGEAIGIVSLGDLAVAYDTGSALADISAAPESR